MHRYTCKIVLRKDRIREDGMCQIYLQAFINKHRKKIPLDIYVNPKHWDEKRSVIMTSPSATLQERETINDDNLVIGHARGKAQKIFTDHRLNDVALTGDEFEKKYKATVSHLDFLAFIEKEIQLLSPPIRSENTIKSYNNTITKLKKYRSAIRFHQVNYELIAGFDRSLKIGEKKQGINSVWKHHRNLKFFINQALRKGIDFENPYRKFKAQSAQPDRGFLSPGEVDTLMKLHDASTLPQNLQRSLRLFLFACWSSLRISDVFQVTHDMLIDGQLVFIPVKSTNRQKIVHIPLSQTARKFIDQYSGKLFARISEKQVNLDLKAIAIEAGIKKKITFHVGRHTFAMMFLESGGSIEQLQKIMGHSSIQTTMIYTHIRTEHLKESVKNMDVYAKKNSEKNLTKELS